MTDLLALLMVLARLWIVFGIVQAWKLELSGRVRFQPLGLAVSVFYVVFAVTQPLTRSTTEQAVAAYLALAAVVNMLVYALDDLSLRVAGYRRTYEESVFVGAVARLFPGVARVVRVHLAPHGPGRAPVPGPGRGRDAGEQHRLRARERGGQAGRHDRDRR